MPPHILRCVHSKNRNCFLGINPLTLNKNLRNALDFKVKRSLFYFFCILEEIFTSCIGINSEITFRK
jgi:hypothetical protein